MKKIKLTKGKFALVDDDDFDYLNQWKWHLTSRGYASRTKYGNYKKCMVRMHRLIMKTPDNMMVDHINHNTLDNRKINLRNVTHGQNMVNRTIGKNNTSGFPGINLDKRYGSITARIRVKRKEFIWAPLKLWKKLLKPENWRKKNISVNIDLTHLKS